MKNFLEATGHWFFYVTMRFSGHRGGVILLVPVIFFYVLCSRKIQRKVHHYLSHRFPGEGGFQYWLYTCKNVYAFGHVLVDRGWLGIRKNSQFECDLIGYDTLEELIARKKGIVLVTAHVGNWQSALAHLDGLPVKVHALMQYDQQAVAKHYFDVKGEKALFDIIDTAGPFGGMIDAAAALQRGEAVTIMGDRLIKGSASTVEFMGEPVRIPDAAYMLAATADAPVAVLLAAKVGTKRYQLKVWDYFYPRYKERADRARMLQECAGKYMAAIEEYLKEHPFQWYNFYNFWEQ